MNPYVRYGTIILGLSVLVLLGLLYFRQKRIPEISAGMTAPITAVDRKSFSKPNIKQPSGTPTEPKKETRMQMTREDRLSLLEQMGKIPDNPDTTDWQLAQQTSWWGKRLDRASFWKDKVIWLDASAQYEANRYGRLYPPIPYDAPAFASRSDEDIDQSSSVSVEGPNVRFQCSNRENAFWNDFVFSHPHPPDDIARAQMEEADALLGMAYHAKRETANDSQASASLSRLRENSQKRLQEKGYPLEAFSDGVLKQSYLAQKRREYQVALEDEKAGNPMTMKRLQRRLYVDLAEISQPDTELERQTVNEWKLSYLRRLKAEKTDEMYIHAYLKAWDFDPKSVFGP